MIVVGFDEEINIQLLIADMPPSETQAGYGQCGMKWDCRVQGKGQLVSQWKTHSRSFPICLEAQFYYDYLFIYLFERT